MQMAPAAPTTSAPNVVEVGGNFSSVTNNQGNWAGQHIRGEFQTDQANRWNALLLHQRKFKENGNYVAVGNVHEINQDYSTDVTIGAGEGIFMPRLRADAFLNRKWLERRNLVTTFGLGTNKSRNGYSDFSGFLGASYYFDSPWIIQGGARFNNSSPGDVFSASYFLAVTQGRHNDYYLTLRYGFGKEAYQVIGTGNTLVDFRSQIVSLNWRQWVEKSTETEKGWGFDATGEYYHNPNYNRTGITLGVFKEF
jgi:YaiO family outer membrane protein